MYLENLVQKLNSSSERPASSRPAKLRQALSSAAGSVGISGYVSKVDTYNYSITSDTTSSARDHWNPITASLRQLSSFDDKSVGIPAAVFSASDGVVRYHLRQQASNLCFPFKSREYSLLHKPPNSATTWKRQRNSPHQTRGEHHPGTHSLWETPPTSLPR